MAQEGSLDDSQGQRPSRVSGREKIWYEGKVIWVTLPDEVVDEEEDEPEDRWPDLLLALECLTPKQRFVIECRYGLRDGRDVLEPAEIASLMGVSRQAVESIEARAIEKMSSWVASES